MMWEGEAKQMESNDNLLAALGVPVRRIERESIKGTMKRKEMGDGFEPKGV